MNPRVRIILPAALASVLGLAALPATGSASVASDTLGKINHIEVIYQANHSFDNLFGRWEQVNGLKRADAAYTLQVMEDGAPRMPSFLYAGATIRAEALVDAGRPRSRQEVDRLMHAGEREKLRQSHPAHAGRIRARAAEGRHKSIQREPTAP